MQLEADFNTTSTKWIVFETPVPEENIVGACRLLCDHQSDTVVVDIICADGEAGVRNNIVRDLVKRVEVISMNMGIRTAIVQIPQWRSDLQDCAISCGFEELGGHLWPADKQPQLIKATMVLEFRKKFSGNASIVAFCALGKR